MYIISYRAGRSRRSACWRPPSRVPLRRPHSCRHSFTEYKYKYDLQELWKFKDVGRVVIHQVSSQIGQNGHHKDGHYYEYFLPPRQAGNVLFGGLTVYHGNRLCLGYGHGVFQVWMVGGRELVIKSVQTGLIFVIIAAIIVLIVKGKVSPDIGNTLRAAFRVCLGAFEVVCLEI